MFDPVLTTQADLEHTWRELMGPWSFGRHSVWMMLVVDDHTLPQLIEVTDATDPPDADQLDGLAHNLLALEREAEPGLRVAFLRSRPGKDVVTDSDREWARSLYAAARRAEVPCEVVHLATRGAIRPVPADVVGIRQVSASRSPRSGATHLARPGHVGDDGRMPLSLDEVEDLIDSWELDDRADTLVHAAQLLETMAVGDPGRIYVLQVVADHQALRGEVDAALATLDRAGTTSDEEADVLQAMRVTFLIGAGRSDTAEPLLQQLRRRGPRLPSEAIERVADTLEDDGRLQEAMRWFTIGLRDLDPQRDLPEAHEEYALIGRWRVRKALELPPDHYDEFARITLDLRRSQ